MYAAASDRKVEWVIIKGISHYVGGECATSKWKRFSSAMAMNEGGKAKYVKKPQLVSDLLYHAVLL